MRPNLQRRMGAAGAALIVGILVAAAAQTARGQAQDSQSQTPDVQQLKDRVRQLEQTVEELKGQINAVQNSQKEKAAARVPPAAPVGENIAAGGLHPAPAETPANGGTPAAKASDEPKKSAGTFELYGFATLDMGYEFGPQNTEWFDTVRPTKLPSFKNEFAPSGHTYFSVRQSRLGAKSS